MDSSMREVSHWDDAPSETEDLGTIGGTEQWLSGAVGAQRLGASRVQVPAGKASTPQHAEDEEVFYVLGGSGWSVQEDGCFAIAAGDVVFYRAWEPAHTLVAGNEGIEYIAFGTTDSENGGVRFPRIDKVRLAGHLLSGDHTHQWELEAKLPRIEVSDPPDPRPTTIVNVADLEPVDYDAGPAQAEAWFLTRGLGARGIALNRADLRPGGESAPPHCHSAVEELFVVLDGDGVLLLGSDEAEHPVRAGSIVGRPAGTGQAHGFRAGDDGLTVLMFSDKHPGDMTFYPRSGKVTLRGLGITFRPEIVPWADA
jgi:uncharacterized cupin superfamily protein